jgi:mannose-1-phosphate guanylyltransferase/mannose-6-phosphate isomerase
MRLQEKGRPMIIPTILSGGSGTRLWPLSRQLYPKQLLPLAGKQTLLQQTILRLTGLEGLDLPLVVCNDEHRFLVAEQLRNISITPAAILLEPIGRNTAPATAVAAMQALSGRDNPLLLVLPADHIIRNTEAFHEAIMAGIPAAEEGKLVTFGIVPDKAETGYGYIKQGEIVERYSGGTPQCFTVERFIEKPDLNRAREFVKTGNYLWNSGMFLFRADSFLEELRQFAPAMVDLCQKAHAASTSDLDFQRLDRETFTACPADSIDYAVMEKTDKAVVVPVASEWNDIGSWSALWEVGGKDSGNNVIQGDVLTHETQGSYLYATHRLLATVGVKDHVVIETADAVLVAHKDQVQDVKKIVNQLVAGKRSEANIHRQVFRPWGSYETITVSDRFQVKKIIVQPGAILSLQKHHHRAEHWIVVRGTAKITRAEETSLLGENESTYIPLGVQHRLENPGIIPLELIEVQSGSYLGEDDIVRFTDNYGRAG